jgi:adsorption protein B
MPDVAFSVLAAYWLLTRELLLLAALGVIASSLDDLFIDIAFGSRRLWRQLAVYSRHRRTRADILPTAASPGTIAVFVPAWQEAAVIGTMLTTFTRRVRHADYRLFVGVYANDPGTRAVVAALADPRIEMVVVPWAGPTTKADCLNVIWQAMLAHERAHAGRCKAVVLHDAEDVPHSRELAVIDHLIPALAMVQLPVLPIPDPASRWIAGHYLDEFAESHGKDLVVREALGAAVPAAGVACAFDRNMLGRIAERLGGSPFDPSSLTEDYEVGQRIHALGGRAALVRMPGDAGGGLVATREHFPASLEAALRQKTRWLIGIALAGWDRIGWQGSLANRYFLLRDRKALANAFVIVIAYVAALLYAGAVLAAWLLPAARALPPLVAAGSSLSLALGLTSAFLLWRLFMRALFTARHYGMVEGLRSLPRAFIANVVNMLAAFRALRGYIGIALGGRVQRWDKTEHRYPAVLPAE